MSVSTQEVQAVVDQVRSWPREKRAELAEGILETLRQEPRRGRGDIRRLLGLLPSDGSPISDEDLDRMLENELLRKYGA